MISIPAALDDVTAHWLTDALRAGGLDGVRVASVTRTPVGHSLMCTLARVVPEYEAGIGPGTPRSVIAKIASPDVLAQSLGKGLRLWEREARFYAELAASLNVRIPRCYYNGSDPQSNRYALLLEDLGHLEARELYEGATPTQATAAVRWLAGFHATWWNSPALASLHWMPTGEDRRRGMRPMIEAAWQHGHEHLMAAGLPSRPLAWLQAMIPRHGEEAFVGAPCPSTVAHGDFRLDNVFFDGDEVVVYDWQSAERGHGLFDLAFFVAGSLPVEQRRTTERELVSLYRRGLVERGIVAPTFDEMFNLYRQHVLTILPILALLGSVDPTDAVRAETVRQLTRRFLVTADDLDVGEYVGLL